MDHIHLLCMFSIVQFVQGTFFESRADRTLKIETSLRPPKMSSPTRSSLAHAAQSLSTALQHATPSGAGQGGGGGEAVEHAREVFTTGLKEAEQEVREVKRRSSMDKQSKAVEHEAGAVPGLEEQARAADVDAEQTERILRVRFPLLLSIMHSINSRSS